MSEPELPRPFRENEDEEQPRAPRSACMLLPRLSPSLLGANTQPVSLLLAPRPPPAPRSSPQLFASRDGLGAYLTPQPSPPAASRIIYSTPDWVVIRDLYPKASVHLLLILRQPPRNLQHPFDALNAHAPADAALLAALQLEVRTLRLLAAKELRRLYGRFSAQDAAREAAMQADVAGELPEGRDWGSEIIAGVHAAPSMNHVHVHVLSRDMVSECVRKRSHYNSFTTPFLVDVEEFPLAMGDPRRGAAAKEYLHRELVCWRCKRGFGNRFKKFKEHLQLELEEWKRE
ncbi:MAG: aprataxin-like protein [Trizodia sp. TS-e1964]|nr:MAG: aprataxin-like protein [Trizodia sp. TS-e1964]